MGFLKNRYNQALVLLVIFALLVVSKNILPSGLIRAPSFLLLPIIDWMNAFFVFLLEYLHLKIATRAVADVVQWLFNIVQNILLGGHKGFRLPALPWTAVAATVTVIAYSLIGWRMALFSGISVVYLAVFGQWVESMQTVIFSVSHGPFISSFWEVLALGVLAY